VGLDWEPKFGKLEDQVPAYLQHPGEFDKEGTLIRDMLNKRYGEHNVNASGFHWQILGARLDSRDVGYRKVAEVVAVGVHSDYSVGSMQKRGDPSRTAPKVHDRLSCGD